jgi:coenzyme Q-binding protein COQ10
MTIINETKIMLIPAKLIYDLVIDVKKYPEFLPWCKSVNISSEIDNKNFHAELLINFKNIFEKYTSAVHHLQISDREYSVEAIAIKGPFKNLINRWKITEIDSNKTQVDFYLQFEFNSILLNKMLGGIFSLATEKMINSFENRAIEISKTNQN